MENEDLRKAAAIAGCGDLPSRKVTASTLLNKVFEGVETANAQTLSSMSLIDAASDGWRKKYCAKGDALQNFCALMPDKSLMFDVLECKVVHVMHACMHACDDQLKGAASCLSWRVHSNGGSKHDQIVHENKVCQQAVDSLLVLTSV
jgi:hypothetical protein